MTGTTGLRAEMRLGWKIVLAACIGMMFGISALPFYTLGVFMKPIAAEFGWTREQVSLGFLAQMFGLLALGWVFGIMTDRKGARIVAVLSQVGLAVGLAAISFVQTHPQWIAAWALMALLGGGTAPITWTRGVAGWFDKARGAALGIALMGTGFTGLIAPNLVTAVVEAYGWRAGYLAMAAAVLVVAVPLTLLLFRDKVVDATVSPLTGASPKEALLSYRFWVMTIVFFAVTFGVGGIIPSLVPLLTDRGLSAAEAATYAGLAGGAVILGRFVAGFLLDRFWAPAVAVGFLILPAISCFVLASGELPDPVLIGLVAAMIGLAAGAEFDIVAFMVTRYFGLKNYGFIYALQMVSLLFAGGLAPVFFGRVYDQTGSYDSILLGVGFGFVIAPLLLLTLGKYRSDAA
jgi:MFS family permease